MDVSSKAVVIIPWAWLPKTLQGTSSITSHRTGGSLASHKLFLNDSYNQSRSNLSTRDHFINKQFGLIILLIFQLFQVSN